MAYSTLQNLIDTIGNDNVVAATCEPGGLTVDNAKVDAAIASADAEIDTYFVSCAVLPMSPVPTIVRTLSTKLTAYQLLMKNNVTATKIDGIQTWREDAIAMLTRLEGKCNMLSPIPTAPTSEASTAIGLRTLSADKKFTTAVCDTMPS